MNENEVLKELIQKAKNIVVMTGAGISVPSGIPDFRSAGGLYSEHHKNLSPETILSYSFFKRYPEDFYEFYKNKMVYEKALPNNSHYFLAELEKLGKLKAVITQNIDGLHSKAGSQKVLELHGSIYRNYCMKCEKSYDLSYILKQADIPKCSCGGIIKPDVTLYEESLNENVLNDAVKALDQADLLIVIGTSLMVHPAASLIHYFKGEDMVIVNKGETPYDRFAKLIIRKPLETVLTKELL